MNKLVFIIIVNFNGLKDTSECINSLLKLVYDKFQILVIDNNSEDNSEEELSSNFPKIKVIQTGNNFGYAKGNNIGISYALEHGAEYLWLLNNDVIVDKDSLGSLIDRYAQSDNAAIVGSKILNYYNHEMIDYAGGIFNMKNGMTYHINRNEIDKKICEEKLINTEFITGCSMFLSKEIFNIIGFMDENYFLYCEDVDWSIRARLKGYDLFVVPTSKIYHKISSTTRREKGIITYYKTRNTLYLLQKLGQEHEIHWRKRFNIDFHYAVKYLFSLNLRAVFNIVNAYLSWINGYQGPIQQKIKVRNSLIKSWLPWVSRV